MNDRFKFRAKRLDNNKLVYGYLCFIYIDNKEHCRIYCPDDCMNYDCYTKTIGQCTGLKDKNGKLIYEGDIVKIDEDLATINWSIYSARFMLDSEEDFFSFDSFYAEDCEVIGNIHKNPELLEVNND